MEPLTPDGGESAGADVAMVPPDATDALPPDAPPGHAAYQEVTFKSGAGVNRPFATFKYMSGNDEVHFQTTVIAAGSRYGAERVARACFMKFEEGASLDEVSQFRAECYAKLGGGKGSMPPTPEKRPELAPAALPSPRQAQVAVAELPLTKRTDFRVACICCCAALALVGVYIAAPTPSAAPSEKPFRTPRPTSPPRVVAGSTTTAATTSERATSTSTAHASTPPATTTLAPASTISPTKELGAEVEELREQISSEGRRGGVAESAARSAAQNASRYKRELEHWRGQLTAAEAKLHAARQVAAKAQEAIRARSAPSTPDAGHVKFPLQWVSATLAAFLGLVAIVGPPGFLMNFNALGGSAMGGLLVGSCFAFFVAVCSGQSPMLPGGPRVLDIVGSLVAGTGLAVGYRLWAVMLFLGALRWFSGFECFLYNSVDEIHLEHAPNASPDDKCLYKPYIAQALPGDDELALHDAEQ